MSTSSPRLEGSFRRSRSARPLGVAIAAVALGAAALALASSLPESTVQTAFSPQWWPQVLAAVLIALGLGNGVVAFRSSRSPDPEPDQEPDPPDERWSIGRLLGVLGATVVYIVAWQLIGYAIATALYTVGLSALLGARGWRGLVLFPVIVTASLVLFFDTLLGVPL